VVSFLCILFIEQYFVKIIQNRFWGKKCSLSPFVLLLYCNKNYHTCRDHVMSYIYDSTYWYVLKRRSTDRGIVHWSIKSSNYRGVHNVHND